MDQRPVTPHEPILAIDPATQSGWASSRGHHGWFKLAGESEAARLEWFGEHVRDLLRGHHALIWPAPIRHLSIHSARIYYSLRAVLLLVARQSAIPAHEIVESRVKKHATGKGNAPKMAMLDAANRILLARGLPAELAAQKPTDPGLDQADAICLLDYWRAESTRV